MEFKLDKGTGYMYTYSPDHPYCNKSGKLYEHTYVICNDIGRLLKEDECVHHIDRNRTNNDLSNLMLLTNSEHASLHMREDGILTINNTVCEECGIDFKYNGSRVRKYCSRECFNSSRVKIHIDARELHELVWSMPTSKLSHILGISDSAISKKCKKLGVDKPGVGYW